MIDTVYRIWNGINLGLGLLFGSVLLGVLLDQWGFR